MNLFYIQDKRQIIGNCMVFWRKKGRGYTTDLTDAMVVQADWKERDTDILWPKDLMDSLAKPRVDHQDLPR